MNEPTKLLLRALRFRFMVSSALLYMVIFPIVLLSGGVFMTPLLLVYCSMLVLLFSQPHLVLSSMAFPVTDRQVAWISLGCLGLYLLMSMASCAMGQLVMLPSDDLDFEMVGKFWGQFFTNLPLMLLISLVLWRLIAFRPETLPALLAAFSMSLTNQKSFSDDLEMFARWWPLWLTACAALVAEAPYLTRGWRARGVDWAGSSYFAPAKAEAYEPTVESPFTKLVNAGFAMLGIGLLVIIAPGVTRWWLGLFEETPLAGWLVPALVLLAGGAAAWQLWKRSRASGLVVPQTLGVIAAHAIGAGHVFRHELGLQDGAIGKCSDCGRWKMAWMQECPHCAGVSEGGGELKRFGYPHDMAAVMFRIMVPAVMGSFLVMRVLMGWNR